MTVAVIVAVRKRLDRICDRQDRDLGDRRLAIGKDCAARLKEPYRSSEQRVLVYDELGLPRWS